MDTPQLIDHTDRLIGKLEDLNAFHGVYTEVCQFLNTYAGPKNEFLHLVKEYNPRNYIDHENSSQYISSILRSFKDYLLAGLHSEITPERRAQLDVVSDFLEQAQTLLDGSGFHPAAPVILIGASLEEFLRTWVEAEGLTMGGKKPGLDAYAKILKEAELISKQDVKDITSWAGLRNHAAHGEWDEVDDKKRVLLMLEGVNLFMRKYGA